jgi:hypothetical protein
MNNTLSSAAISTLAVALAGAAALVSGCHNGDNPFTDELAGNPPVTTPSADAARAASVEPRLTQRPHTHTEVRSASGVVTHGPLYFEDPYENPPDEDDVFEWSGEDYAHLAYGPARFLVNTVLFPVSAAVTPPWLVLESDGQNTKVLKAADNREDDASSDDATVSGK